MAFAGGATRDLLVARIPLALQSPIEIALGLLGVSLAIVLSVVLTYLADDHFDTVSRDKSVEFYEGPTPRLETKSDHLLVTTLRDMGETARDVTEAVATDSGATVDGLADQLGKHPATIYRAIEDLGDGLELNQGDVSFRAHKYREELRALVESAEYAIESERGGI